MIAFRYGAMVDEFTAADEMVNSALGVAEACKKFSPEKGDCRAADQNRDRKIIFSEFIASYTDYTLAAVDRVANGSSYRDECVAGKN